MRNTFLLTTAVLLTPIALAAAVATHGAYDVEVTRAATVVIKREDMPGHGSGVVVSDNVVLTAAHVVGNAREVFVEFTDGSIGKGRPVYIGNPNLAEDGADFAVLWLERPSPVRPARATCREPRRGELVEVIGAPGMATSFRSWNVSSWGHVSSKVGSNSHYWFMDVGILPGNSGGPVVDESGYVISIVSFVLGQSMFMGGFSHLSGHVSIASVCGILESLGVRTW